MVFYTPYNAIVNNHDDYMTPRYAWENIKDYIPRDKVIWEAFYGNGKSGEYLRDMGFEVIHENIDFFENNLGDIIVTNPPFSKKEEVFKRLFELDKPFIMIVPMSTICYQYMREYINKLQFIIPHRRIQFDKIVNGEYIISKKNSCNFDCVYACYKINLPRDIIRL